jgi:hypothetical protein
MKLAQNGMKVAADALIRRRPDIKKPAQSLYSPPCARAIRFLPPRAGRATSISEK